MKDEMRNVNMSEKAFGRPEKGCCHELEQCVIECVREKRNEGFTIMWEVIRIEALELLHQMQIPVWSTASVQMRWARLILWWCTTLTRLLREYAEKLVKLQRHVIK
jgi:hypothetical protein